MGRVAWSISDEEWKFREEMFTKGYLWCVRCQGFSSVDNFRKNRLARFGYTHYCKRCLREMHEGYYQERGGKFLKRRRNSELKRKYVALSGGECARCGWSEFVAGLDFHHVDRKHKRFNPVYTIISGNFSFAYSELDKCVLLCACCHRGVWAGQWDAEFVKRDGLGYGIARWWLTDTERSEEQL
jgi:hypothetical protein